MKKKRSRRSCHRLGVFTAWFNGHYQSELISGIEEAAGSRDVQGVFADFDKSIASSTKPGFEALCMKYGIVGRERDIIRLLIGGLLHKGIAFRLNISLRAVEYHITKIYKKCGVNSKYNLLEKFRG